MGLSAARVQLDGQEMVYGVAESAITDPVEMVSCTAVHITRRNSLDVDLFQFL